MKIHSIQVFNEYSKFDFFQVLNGKNPLLKDYSIKIKILLEIHSYTYL